VSGASDVLEAALNVMDTTLEMYSLIAAIDAALAVKAPAGDPAIIAAQADTYGRVANLCQEVEDDEQTVQTKSLPASWRGQAAESATDALFWLGEQAGRAQSAFAAGSKALATWADQLRTAQSQDAHGRAQLEGARTLLSLLDQQDLLTLHPSLIPPATRETAISGCHDRWEAANLAADAAASASAALSQWPEQARAQAIRVTGVNALTAVILAYNTSEPLTLTAETQASKHLDAMSAADRTAFETLVAHASSITEAQYLWKAASVNPGYHVRQLESFDAVIHPHASNESWLAQHLDPGIINLNQPISAGNTGPQIGPQIPISFTGNSVTYSQEQDPDCVAASTVMARLAADPVLMLGVTTGQGPAAVGGAKAGDDTAAAVTARAQTLFSQSYAYGRAVEGDDAKKFLGITYQAAAPPGIGPQGAIALDNKLLTPVTGSTYEYQPLNDITDRQAALPKIEAAVEAGQPVPIDVETVSGRDGHQMVIEDYQQGDFEIYNPWGFTQSVPTQLFVDGQLGALTDPAAGGPPGGIPDPVGVALPQQ
jgi:hypothetical protein